MSSPYLTMMPAQITTALFHFGYQAEMDELDGMPVAHTVALMQLLIARREAIEDRVYDLRCRRQRLVDEVVCALQGIHAARAAWDASATEARVADALELESDMLSKVALHREFVAAIDRDLESYGPYATTEGSAYGPVPIPCP